jgi:hypothetical protein
MTNKYTTDDLISMLRNPYGRNLDFKEVRQAAADKLEALQHIANAANSLSDAIAEFGVGPAAVGEAVQVLDHWLVRVGYDK